MARIPFGQENQLQNHFSLPSSRSMFCGLPLGASGERQVDRLGRHFRARWEAGAVRRAIRRHRHDLHPPIELAAWLRPSAWRFAMAYTSRYLRAALLHVGNELAAFLTTTGQRHSLPYRFRARASASRRARPFPGSNRNPLPRRPNVSNSLTASASAPTRLAMGTVP